MPDPTWRLAARNAPSESASSSSSDSDESLSSSDEDANLHYFGAGRAIPADEPRRVGKARRHTLDALLAVFTLLDSVRDRQTDSALTSTSHGPRGTRGRGLNAGVHEPWSTLEKALGELVLALKDRRVRDEREIMAGLAVLDHLIAGHLITLVQDKAYIRQCLSQTEAKSVRPFLRQWDKVRQEPNYPSASDHTGLANMLQAVPAVLLCRMASYTLSPPLREGTNTLDLSRLPFDDVAAVLERIDLFKLLQVFGGDVIAVSHLSVARNKLPRFPIWSNFPFPNLVDLDVSYNDRIAHLPLSFTRLTHLKRATTIGTHLAVFDNARGARPAPSPAWTAPHLQGPPSLVDSTLRLVLRHVGADPADEQSSTRLALAAHLPLHLGDKVLRGYSCEMCNRTTWPGRAEYADEEVEVSLLVRAEEGEDAILLPDGEAGKAIRVCGRTCLACCRKLGARWDVRWRSR